MPVTTLDPKTALVVIDLQNGIVGMPGAPYPASAVLARTVQLADAFRARALPVVLVHVTSAADGSDAVPGRAEAPRPTTPRPAGWDTIVDDLAGHPSDIIVTKRNWGAFYGTDLNVTAYVENLFDDSSVTYIHPEAFLDGRYARLRPRTIGVRLGYQF